MASQNVCLVVPWIWRRLRKRGAAVFPSGLSLPVFPVINSSDMYILSSLQATEHYVRWAVDVEDERVEGKLVADVIGREERRCRLKGKLNPGEGEFVGHQNRNPLFLLMLRTRCCLSCKSIAS